MFKFSRHIPRIFFKKGLPLNLIFFVTAKCNARCRHCFFWREINQSEAQLTLPEIERIAKSIPHLMALSLTGGEPFLRDDLAEIALMFSRFASIVNLQIPTNGLLTEQIVQTSRKILSKCRQDIRFTVAVSLDDLGEKHDAIRRVPGVWDKAIETIKRLKELEKQFSNFSVSSCITINKDNQERVGELANFLKNDLKVEDIGVNLIRAEVKDMSLKEVNLKYYNNAHLKIREDFFKRVNQQPKPSIIDKILSSREYFGSRLISKIYSERRYTTPCYAGSLLAILRENGDVYPCEMLDLKMGNLSDFDFNLKELWYSGPAEEARRKIKKMKCFCTYECAMTLNTLFNPRHLFTILKNTLLSKN